MDLIDSKLVVDCKALRDSRDESVHQLIDSVTLLISIRSTGNRSEPTSKDPPWLPDLNASIENLLTSRISGSLRAALFGLISVAAEYFNNIEWFPEALFPLLFRFTCLEVAMQLNADNLDGDLICKLLTIMEFILREINSSDRLINLLTAHDNQLLGLMELLKQTLQTMISYSIDTDKQKEDESNYNIQMHIIRVVCDVVQSEEEGNTLLPDELSVWFPKTAQFLIALSEKHPSHVTIGPLIDIYLKSISDSRIHGKNVPKEVIAKLELFSS